MLNLRGMHFTHSLDDTDTSSRPISDIRFATIVGDLATPLNTTGFMSQSHHDDADNSEPVEISSNRPLAGLSPETPDQIEIQNSDVGGPALKDLSNCH